jgi:hypothetical protein
MSGGLKMLFTKLVAGVMIALAWSGSAVADDLDPYKPVFTKGQDRIADIKKRFPDALAKNASDYEPLVITPGTHVHMGFWGGPYNHGNLERLVDSINAGVAVDKVPGCKRGGNCAVFADGATSMNQYPEYVTMLKQHWYERGNAQGEGQPFSKNVTIYGQLYRNIQPLYFPEADSVWGTYSQGYAYMARVFYEKTKNPVTIWVFVNGAHQQRIFDRYEKPVLQELEKAGIVEIYCAKSNNLSLPLDQSLSAFEKGLDRNSCIPTEPPQNQPELINVFNRM